MKKLGLVLLLFFNQLLSVNFGQRFILTLPVTPSYQYLKNWLQKTKPAGVMLLGYHVKDRVETKKLTIFLQDEAKKMGIPKLVIAIDWEGGVISKPDEQGGFVSLPSPHNLGLSDRTYSFLAGKLIGQQMRSVGINMNFAPSLDLFDPKKIVLGSRTFSDNPKQVLDRAIAFTNGLESEGVIPVFKHFPGLGLGFADTHIKEISIDLNKKDFEKHVSPFVSVLKQKQNPFIMVGHAKYPTIFENLPSTLSRKVVSWIKDKNKNCFLITDDFYMKGVNIKEDLSELVFDSLFAGYDLIVYSPYSPYKKFQDIKLIEKLNKHYENLDNDKKRELDIGFDRISKMKIELLADVCSDEHQNILPEKKTAKYLASKTIKEFYPNLNVHNSLMLTVDIPKLRPGQNWFVRNGKSYLAYKLEKNGLNVKELIFNPKDKESVALALEFVRKNYNKSKKLILSSFFYGTGVWNENQKKLFEKLSNIKDKVVVSFSHPYEQILTQNSKIFNLGCFHKPQIKELVKRLTKNSLPSNEKLLIDLKRKVVGKKIGLLCHNASRFKLKNKTIFLPDYLYSLSKRTKRTTLAALFSPEHGLFGNMDAAVKVSSENRSKWNCPIYSLHGVHKKPTKEMLSGLDLLVIDLREVGIRAFTYLSSLDLALQAAAENNLPVIVLDFPNPIYFWKAQGPKLSKGFETFVGRIDIPFIHGKTFGAIANHLAQKYNVKIDILKNYDERYFKNYFKAGNYFEPSPNLATLESVYSYPMTIFIEGTNYSEGRGTKFPFQQIGAPWVDSQKLASILNSQNLSGVYFEPVHFKPLGIPGKSLYPKQQNKICGGVFVHLYDLKIVNPILIGKTILKNIFQLYPNESEYIKYSNRYFLDNLAGNDLWRKSLLSIFLKTWNFYDLNNDFFIPSRLFAYEEGKKNV